jgi:hypothetical protein
VEQLAVGLADGLLGILELVGDVGPRFLGLGEALLQRLDAPAQLLELVLGRGGRVGGGQRREQRGAGPGVADALLQPLAFDWAATAAAACAAFSGSPR